MKQEINLYQERFKKARIAFPAGTMLAAGFAVLLLAGGWGARELWRLDGLEDRLLTLNQRLVQLAAEQQALQSTLKSRAPASSLVARLKKLETVAAYQAPLEEIMSSGAFPAGSGYSNFFLAFARQDLRGTWLTRIRIVGAGREILFKGYATTPELVPRYLQRLTSEQVMQGTEFQAFRMALPEAEAGKRRPAKIAFAVSTSLDEADWLPDEE